MVGVVIFIVVLFGYLSFAGTEKTLDAIGAGVITPGFYCRKKRREIVSDEEMKVVLPIRSIMSSLVSIRHL